MKGNRYNAVEYGGTIYLNDQLNDCTLRSVSASPESRRVFKQFAKHMNEEAGDKNYSRRICEATITTLSRLSINDQSKFDTLELVIGKALKADYWSARPRNEWERIANALDHDYLAHFTPRELDAAWRRMVRNGFVRSYQKGGKRLYEMNLVEDESHFEKAA